jgi:hypothetical protein
MAEVGLPGDVVVHARSLRAPRTRERPDFGVYLCGRRGRGRATRGWTGTWRMVWLDWPAFGVPRDTGAAVAALVEAHRRARAGELVEVACGSGRSRTGTALAALAVCGGLDADAAVAWVRAGYPPAKMITPGQRRWLRTVSGALQAV